MYEVGFYSFYSTSVFFYFGFLSEKTHNIVMSQKNMSTNMVLLSFG